MSESWIEQILEYAVIIVVVCLSMLLPVGLWMERKKEQPKMNHNDVLRCAERLQQAREAAAQAGTAHRQAEDRLDECARAYAEARREHAAEGLLLQAVGADPHAELWVRSFSMFEPTPAN